MRFLTLFNKTNSTWAPYDGQRPYVLLYSRNKGVEGKVSTMYSIKQCIDNMYTQVAIHASTIGSLAASQFFPLLLLIADRWVLSSFSLLLLD